MLPTDVSKDPKNNFLQKSVQWEQGCFMQANVQTNMNTAQNNGRF